MVEVLKFTSEHYDLVFLDSPPILPVSDAAVISSIVEKTILLVEWNKTDRELVCQAIERVNLGNGHRNRGRAEQGQFIYDKNVWLQL